jgi:hypothetical protein
MFYRKILPQSCHSFRGQNQVFSNAWVQLIFKTRIPAKEWPALTQTWTANDTAHIHYR